MIPPKPVPRAARVRFWTHLRMFRRDILSAQPEKLYRAWMAEFRTPFFRSYLVNDPELLALVLNRRPADFPKSARVTAGLVPLLGRSVFVTNGEEWARQRRIIDPAFEGGRLHETLPGIWAAAQAAIARLGAGGTLDIEPAASHLAADVIFRTLFSIPIEDGLAAETYAAFQAYQRAQPVLNAAAVLPWPRRLAAPIGRRARAEATRLRSLIARLCADRAAEIAAGTAPDDLATKIMTTPDPVTGQTFTTAEMVDQVAIFFLAGHETSASALAWALYLLAIHPEVQAEVAAEVDGFGDTPPTLTDVARLRLTRDVFRETLRLYPPVPMMVRETTRVETFRGRAVRPGAQVVLSPWHLHRHERLWPDPDRFDPGRWSDPGQKPSQRDAYLPFSAGPRVCTGAGFAMVEGVVLIAALTRAFAFQPVGDRVPVPVAHLTVRARDGILLDLVRRG
jgi:cytochrome P450